jgi:N-acetylglucosamine-6-phosphate deacetylase
MPAETVLFRNAKIVGSREIWEGFLLADGERGKIAALGRRGEPEPRAERIIDAGGLYVSPGFIDIHTHGAGGADFMDGDIESIYTACRAHFRHGTTTILPTLLGGGRAAMTGLLELFDHVDAGLPGMPHIPGVHLEGPYFAKAHKGAQDEKYLRNPDPAEYGEILGRSDKILRWSFAVELPGGRDFLKFLKEHGVIASLAHSDATCADVEEAVRRGLAALTHFYSCMNSVRRVNAYRVAGAVEAGYLLDDLFVEVIADGAHLPAELLRLIYKIKGPGRICLVTDSMRAAGMPDGSYILGPRDTGLAVIVEDGVAKMPDRSCFAGSVATADRLVRTMRDLAGVPLHEAVRMAAQTPAALLGLAGTKGSLEPGMDADLAIFDEDIQIYAVMAGGRLTGFRPFM